MKQLYCKRLLSCNLRCLSADHRGDGGYYVIIGAIVILVLLAIVGAAIDMGRLYTAGLRLQRSLDAGAVAGSHLMLSATQADAVSLAKKTVRQNLKIHKLDGYLKSVGGSDIQVTFEASAGTAQNLRVSATLDVPTVLISRIKDLRAPTHIVVGRTAVGTTRRVVMGLTLDLTNSMNQTLPGNSNLKIDDLKTAARQFVPMFRDGIDYMSIVTFNRTATILVPLTNSGFKTALPNIIGDINNVLGAGYTLADGTNHDDALRVAYNSISTPATYQAAGLSDADYQSAFKIIVMITDGAPSATCQRPANPTNVYPPPAYDTTCTPVVYPQPPNGDFTSSVWYNQFGPVERSFSNAIQRADHIRRQSALIAGNSVTILSIGIGGLQTWNNFAPACCDVNGITLGLCAGNPGISDALLRCQAYDAYQSDGFDVLSEGNIKTYFLNRLSNIQLGTTPTNPALEPLLDPPFCAGTLNLNCGINPNPPNNYFCNPPAIDRNTLACDPVAPYLNTLGAARCPGNPTDEYCLDSISPVNSNQLRNIREYQAAYPNASKGTVLITPNSAQLKDMLRDVGALIQGKLVE